jgi:hypothetical protein
MYRLLCCSQDVWGDRKLRKVIGQAKMCSWQSPKYWSGLQALRREQGRRPGASKPSLRGPHEAAGRGRQLFKGAKKRVERNRM